MIHDTAPCPVPYMQPGVDRYLRDGIPPGSFLRALFANDLVTAVVCADAENLAGILSWARWLVNDIDHLAWGSEAKVRAWCEARQAAQARHDDGGAEAGERA